MIILELYYKNSIKILENLFKKFLNNNIDEH